MTSLTETAGLAIRELRQRRGMTLDQLSLATTLSPSHLSEVERGMTVISLARLEQLAAALEVEPLSLLGVSGSLLECERKRARAELRLRRIAAYASGENPEQPQHTEQSVDPVLSPSPLFTGWGNGWHTPQPRQEG